MAIWNPWHGCKKISPGCYNCYVYRRDAEFGKDSSIVKKTAAVITTATAKAGCFCENYTKTSKIELLKNYLFKTHFNAFQKAVKSNLNVLLCLDDYGRIARCFERLGVIMRVFFA